MNEHDDDDDDDDDCRLYGLIVDSDSLLIAIHVSTYNLLMMVNSI